MREFSRQELDAAFHDYATRVEALRTEAEGFVAGWSYADAWPFGLHPLFAVAEMGSEAWKPKKLKWGPQESIESWHAQGVDAAGRIRVVHNHWKQFRVYLYGDAVVDEVFVRQGKLDSLQRAIVEDGLVRAVYDYRLSPHQTYVEKYEYANGRCVRSVNQCEFVSGNEWKTASWQTICDFEHDERGLVRAYQDQPGLSGRKLVFLRPGPKSKEKQVERRPIVAYAVPDDTTDEGPEHSVYCDVYGLEMNYDDEWPLDVVPFLPAEYVSSFFTNTELASRGTVYAGAIPAGNSPDFRALVKARATWALIDANEPEASSRIASAWTAGLSVLLVVESEERLRATLAGRKPPAPKRSLPVVGALLKKLGKGGPALERLAVAFRSETSVSSSEAQATAKRMREALTAIGAVGSRILIAGGSLKADLTEYLTLPDLDGAYFEEGGFGAAVEAAGQLALLRSAQAE